MLTLDTTNEDFFNIQSIVIIGASNKEGIGKQIFFNLISRFNGEIFPVNPSYDKILSFKYFKSILDIPITIDLAVITTPSKTISRILEEIGKKGIKKVLIISSGFKENGEEGRKLEKRIQNLAKDFQLKIIGPNCLGFIHSQENNTLNATFLNTIPKIGKTSLISQSGGICSIIASDAISYNIGFSKIISIGNKTIMDECDFLEILSKDKEMDIIAMYLENISNIKRFAEISQQITRHLKKPIILIKVGCQKMVENLLTIIQESI